MTEREILLHQLDDAKQTILECLESGYSVSIFKSRSGLKLRKETSTPAWFKMSVKLPMSQRGDRHDDN